MIIINGLVRTVSPNARGAEVSFCILDLITVMIQVGVDEILIVIREHNPFTFGGGASNRFRLLDYNGPRNFLCLVLKNALLRFLGTLDGFLTSLSFRSLWWLDVQNHMTRALEESVCC